MIKYVNYVVFSLDKFKPTRRKLQREYLVKVIDDQEIALRFNKMRKLFSGFLTKEYIGIFLCDLENNQCIAYGWLCPPFSKKPNHLSKSYQNSNLWWIYNCRVMDEYRGKGYYQLLLSEMINYIDHSYADTDIWIDTTDTNKASLKAIKNLGFKFATTQTSLVFPSLRGVVSQLLKRIR